MVSVLRRQFIALFWKNIIIVQRHWLLNLLRCLIFPVAYGVFLAFTPKFFTRPGDLGIGTAIPIFHLQDHYNGKSPIVWVDNTSGTGYLSASEIMDHVTANFTQQQLDGVTQAKDEDELMSMCLGNLNNASPCYITITFENIPSASTTDNSGFNYTLMSDYGAYRVNIEKHSSDFETKVVPAQWAIDSAIIELSTGKPLPQILEMPYTHGTNSNTRNSSRLFFLSLIGRFGGVTFLLAFVGITYQLTGGLALERATLLTSHMQAMGALDSARILSWYSSTVLFYFPAWIVLGGLWKATLFMQTSTGLMILISLLSGLGLASWSCIVSVPFSKSPQLAAVVAAGAAIILGVVPLMVDEINNKIAPPVLSFFFPSMFYVFMIKDFSGFEISSQAPDLSHRDPTFDFQGTPLVVAVLLGIVFWPIFAVYFERWLYGVSNPSNTSSKLSTTVSEFLPSAHTAIRLRNIQKKFNPSLFKRKSREVLAIADLSLDIPSYGIFVLLGPNGAGKSTTLSILGGLTKETSGSVTFSESTSRPPRGTIGIVPQKNVLFSELSCLENLRIWNAIKADGYQSEGELRQLIRNCDLESKMHEPAGTLSGGQKRKLQLAVGLVGGSKIILVDECTSGVDPLSRRAIWKILTSYREERTIILTTHFLDEAEFLADHIAVLDAPGKLIASDSPVALKSSMGEGYTITAKIHEMNSTLLLTAIQKVAPDTVMTSLDTHSFNYLLKTNDTSLTAAAVQIVEKLKVKLEISSYDVVGTTIEDIFLDLLSQDNGSEPLEYPPVRSLKSGGVAPSRAGLVLSNGKMCRPWEQALTIFHKRYLIARRSWLTPLLVLVVGISGAWWPIRFVTGGVASCAHVVPQSFVSFASYPPSLNNNTFPVSPPSLIPQINATLPELFANPILKLNPPGTFPDLGPFNPFFPVIDKESLIEYINQNRLRATLEGGLYMDFDTNDFFIAYDVTPGSLTYFSIASNLFFAHANESTGATVGPKKIITTYSALPSVTDESLLSMQWLAIFGAAMVAYPAFFALYIAKERHSSVQAMQLSNGLSNPLGLWMGHLLFDSMFTVVIATVIAAVYGEVRQKFQGIGYLWLLICLYGLASTLYAYIIAIIVKSPLGAFAIAVVYQFFIYLLYLTGYIVTFFTGNPQVIQQTFNLIHFTTALSAPIISLLRGAMVSINQFSLACGGEKVASGTSLGTITRFGGPIVYLILWNLVLLFALARVDSGDIRLPWAKASQGVKLEGAEENHIPLTRPFNEDVEEEAKQASSFSNADPLRVLNVVKYFGNKKAVDNVTFTIPDRSLFAMLGPNGAGKTTTLDIIRGSLKPNSGDVFVNGASTRTDVKKARLSFGVCPQFTAMDAHITVKEHLYIYGRLRGLSGSNLNANIFSIMRGTGLDIYADRLATKLSGGNQRKLALAIALMGNPSVILVDEYSTGIDAKMKRELWEVLKQATSNKAVLLTTHSMEEASYLATKVGIISQRMLAVGTPDELESRNESYEVHFSCQTREELVRVRQVMASIPGARMSDDVATRFEIPLSARHPNSTGKVTSVASIFEILEKQFRRGNLPQFTVGKSSLETAFIKIINADSATQSGGGKR